LSQETEDTKQKQRKIPGMSKAQRQRGRVLVTNISITTKARHKSKRDAIKAIGRYHLPQRLIMQNTLKFFL
jgi:hypothetical protein